MATSVPMIFEKANFEPTSSAVRPSSFCHHLFSSFYFITGPVAAVTPTQDHQSYLVTTLDSHVRLMDASTGKLLNDFESHLNNSYRCRACFGSNEASVVCGDENGQVWAWDLLDVSYLIPNSSLWSYWTRTKATVLQPNPPPKVHHKVITWTEHHPSEAGEMVTASADGTIKIWRHAS